MSVLEPVRNTIEEKSETICSAFPSLQASNERSWSDTSPIISGNLFYSNGDSWNFISSAQFYDIESWVLITDNLQSVFLFGVNLSFWLLLNSLLSLLSGSLFVILDWRNEFYSLSCTTWEFIHINSWWSIHSISTCANWESLICWIKICKLFVSKSVESNEPLLLWYSNSTPLENYWDLAFSIKMMRFWWLSYC